MKPADWTLLALAAIVAVGATLFTDRWLAEPGAPRAKAAGTDARAGEPAGRADELARLERTLAELGAHQAELERTLARLEATPDSSAAPEVATLRLAPAELEQAVASWMEQNGEALLATLDDEDALAEARRNEADRAVAILQSGDWPEEGQAAFWQSLRDSGRLDDVIAVLESSAEASPYDADLRVDLATAYGQKAYDLGPGPMQALMRQKQDEAFDAALEVVPDHWDARFGKAMGLSDWPTFLGKTSEAIHQFELLADQQEHGGREERHMQTYFFLGNLYRESGRPQEALAAWNRGLERFPGTTMLEEQVSALAGEGADR